MVSHFTIVQYVPDAASAERVNIGVIAFGGGVVKPLFLEKWHRVKSFASQDISFLRDFARDARRFDEQSLLRAVSDWQNTIQFTEPSASLLPPDELLVDVASLYLSDKGPAQRGYRIKTEAVELLKRRVREKLVDRLGPVGRAFLKDRDYPLRGLHKLYQFDLCVGNGDPLFAAQALSFEMPEGKVLDKEIGAAAWLVQEVKEETPDFPIGVAVLPPKNQSRVYDEAKKIFADLKAELVPENNFSAWAGMMVEKVPLPPSFLQS